MCFIMYIIYQPSYWWRYVTIKFEAHHYRRANFTLRQKKQQKKPLLELSTIFIIVNQIYCDILFNHWEHR